MSESPRRQLRTLVLLLALFFIPEISSFALYYGFKWRPAGGTNHGELLTPMNQLPAVAAPLLEKWALVYVGDGRRPVDWIAELLAARESVRGAPKFADNGLYFCGADYDPRFGLPPTVRDAGENERCESQQHWPRHS